MCQVQLFKTKPSYRIILDLLTCPNFSLSWSHHNLLTVSSESCVQIINIIDKIDSKNYDVNLTSATIKTKPQKPSFISLLDFTSQNMPSHVLNRESYNCVTVKAAISPNPEKKPLLALLNSDYHLVLYSLEKDGGKLLSNMGDVIFNLSKDPLVPFFSDFSWVTSSTRNILVLASLNGSISVLNLDDDTAVTRPSHESPPYPTKISAISLDDLRVFIFHGLTLGSLNCLVTTPDCPSLPQNSKTLVFLPNGPLIRFISTFPRPGDEVGLVVGAVDVSLLHVATDSMTVRSSRQIESLGVPGGLSVTKSRLILGVDGGILQFVDLESASSTTFRPALRGNVRGLAVSPWGVYLAVLIESPHNRVQRNLCQFSIHIFETSSLAPIFAEISSFLPQQRIFCHDVYDYVRRYIKNDGELREMVAGCMTASPFLLNLLKLQNLHVKQNPDWQSKIEAMSEAIVREHWGDGEVDPWGTCGICGKEVDGQGLMGGTCLGGHAVVRCPLSLRICQPFDSMDCDYCGTKYSKMTVGVDSCLFCNKLFM